MPAVHLNWFPCGSRGYGHPRYAQVEIFGAFGIISAKRVNCVPGRCDCEHKHRRGTKAICRILYGVVHNLRYLFVFQGSGMTKKSATETVSNTLFDGELTANWRC